MAIKYGKKKYKQHYGLYTILTAILLCAVFLTMVSSLYTTAEEAAYETLHEQTKQIKDDIILQLVSDRENLSTMASFAAKLYSDGESYDLMFSSFKPIGLIENIGILQPNNVFVTKAGSIDLSGKISFYEEALRDIYISGRIKDLTRSDGELIRSAVPIRVDGKTVGILYGVIKLDAIGKRYAQMAQDFDAQLFVYAKDTGDLVIDTVHDTLGNISFLQDRKYNKNYSYEEFISTDKGFTSFASAYRDENLHLHYSTIDEFDWVIAMGRYDSQVFAATHILAHTLVVVFFIMLLVIGTYVLSMMANERRVNAVINAASNVRKTLLETTGKQDHIAEALKQVCRFAHGRSAVFYNTDGEAYRYISPLYRAGILQGDEKKHLMAELFRYAAEVHKINGATVNLLCIKPNRHLKETNPSFYEFLKTHSIEEIDLSATVSGANHITILSVINAKNGAQARMLAEKVSACFSMALYNQNNLTKTKLAATTDGLTGAYNRVAFNADLPTFNEEQASDFSCLYIDVNELHAINNKLGHAAGDEMLLYVANTLKEVFFGHKIYRMGGDEFVVFCKNTQQEDVKKSIEILNDQLKVRDYHVAIGMSYRTKNTSTEEMVHEAELRMYEAKALYYQAKETQPAPVSEEEYVQTKTGNDEIDTILSILKEKYHGIYGVNLDTDKARRILMPAYLKFNENEEHFSELFGKYVVEAVNPDDHRAVSSFLNYDAIRHQLAEGITPKITYKKNGGETVVLSVYKVCDTGADASDTLWVFAKA